MNKSACLKVVFSGKQPRVLRFADFDFTPLLAEFGGSTVDDFVTISLLKEVFPSELPLLKRLPKAGGSSEEELTFIGSSIDNTTYSGHPNGGVSLVGFNETLVREFLLSRLNPFSQDAKNVIVNTPLPSIEKELAKLGYNDFLINPLPTEMEIVKCSEEDLLDNGYYYEDAFQAVKDRLSNQVGVLERDGFDVANYSLYPEKITVKSDCSLELKEVCVSSGIVRFLDSSEIPESGSARYRLNYGAWHRFSGSESEGENLVVKLFKDINSKTGKQLFYNGIDSDGQKYAFYSPEGVVFIGCGELDKSENNYFQGVTGNTETNTIEFETTTGGSDDLIKTLYGGNKKLRACVVSEWYGR